MENPFAEISAKLDTLKEQVYSINLDKLPALSRQIKASNTPTTDPAKFGTSRQLAKRYGVHFNTIYNWHRAGYFPKHTVDGVTLYAVADIDAFIESKAATAATA